MMRKLKQSFSVLSTLMLTSLVSNGLVILTVEPNGTMGITVSASGSIDLPFADTGVPFSLGLLDGGLSASSFPDAFNLSAVYLSGVPKFFEANAVGTEVSELANVGGGAIDIDYDTLDLGSYGNGFIADSFGFTVYNPDFIIDGASPTESFYNFDFVLTDLDGSLSDYVDGLVLWDSDGLDNETGEKVVFRVIPEPSSALLLMFSGGLLLFRRRRAH